MKIAATTIVSRSLIAYARVLEESFARFHPEIPFFVQFAENDFPLRDDYDEQERSYASTPYVLAQLLDQGFDAVAFFKQESLVTGDLTPILQLLERHSIVLVPHILEPLTAERELNILQSGVYNVGFLGISNTPTARAFLAWWQDRCREHCLHDVPNGMHFEQRWLDLVPSYFEDHVIVRDESFNIGHWNLPERAHVAPRYVRFSGFDPAHPDAVTKYSTRLSMKDIGPLAELFRWYVRRVFQPVPVPGRVREPALHRAIRVWKRNREKGIWAAIRALARGVRRAL